MTVEVPGFEPTAGPEIPGGTYTLEYNASKAQLVLFSPFDHATHKCVCNPDLPAIAVFSLRMRKGLQLGSHQHHFMIPRRVLLPCTDRYELSTMYDAWMSVDDQHQLLELLMRHMTSRCNGYPAF